MKISDSALVVLHGFLSLPNLEKLALVEAINEYFDSSDREPIRAENDRKFEEISISADWKCVCCGK